MANSLVCGKSLLKATDYRLKGKAFSHKICNKCDLGITENVQHLIFECSGETFLECSMDVSVPTGMGDR